MSSSPESLTLLVLPRLLSQSHFILSLPFVLHLLARHYDLLSWEKVNNVALHCRGTTLSRKIIGSVARLGVSSNGSSSKLRLDRSEVVQSKRWTTAGLAIGAIHWKPPRPSTWPPPGHHPATHTHCRIIATSKRVVFAKCNKAIPWIYILTVVLDAAQPPQFRM